MTDNQSQEDPAPDVSAVIVNYNSGPLLARCIAALRSEGSRRKLETIVVDNGSTDGSLDDLPEEHHPDLAIRAGRNLGFGRANNLGIANAHGRYLLLVNTDCFVEAGLVDRLAGLLSRNPSIAVAGPRLLNPDGTLQPSCHNFPTPAVLFLEQSNLWHLFSGVPRMRDWLQVASNHDRPRQVDWLVGACMMLRAGAFRHVGGFDRRFFFYWEEADLCLRLRKVGFEVWFEPSARAVHIGGASTVVTSMLPLFFKGLYLFYRQHYSAWALPVARAIVRLMALYKAARSYALASLKPMTGTASNDSSEQARAWFRIARL